MAFVERSTILRKFIRPAAGLALLASSAILNSASEKNTKADFYQQYLVQQNQEISIDEIAQSPVEIELASLPQSRIDCTLIKNTEYNSPDERDWYLDHCVRTIRITGIDNSSPITYYYGRPVSGYPIGDGGGFYKGEGKSGVTAACGEKWSKGTVLRIEGYDKPIICDDRGMLAYNGIDLYFDTNEEAVKANLPSSANVTEVE